MNEKSIFDERKCKIACGAKIKYTDKKQASKACVAMEERYGVPFAPYQCKYCHWWHIGRDRKLEAGK